ncbi:hypothetical protein KKF91_14480 [Myxococcota bacterium]|nr:hypothetical protein [Myxococcota bacterium]
MIYALCTLALLWSGERSYLIDVEAATLSAAPGWIDSRDGAIWRYRLHTTATRQRRHTRLEVLRPGADRFTPIQPPISLEGDGESEALVLQFQGDYAALARFDRDAAGRRVDEAWISLPSGAIEPLDADTQAALRWVDARLGGGLEGCPLNALPSQRFQGAGGTIWTHLRFGEAGCQGLPSRYPTPSTDAPVIEGWDQAAQTLRRAGHPPLTGLADLRDLGGGARLALIGPPLPFDQRLSGPLDYSDPRPQRALKLLRPSGEVIPLGALRRVDGLRVLAADDPLVEARAWLFTPLGGPGGGAAEGCYITTTPLHHDGDEAARAKALKAAPPLQLSGHLCRIEPQDEAGWDHPEDLSAAVRVEIARAEAIITVITGHPEDAEYDLWLGGYSRVITITPKGIKQRRRHKNARLRRVEGGVEVTVLASQLGAPPALNVRVMAHGHALWALGAPVDNRNRQRTPLALQEEAEE